MRGDSKDVQLQASDSMAIRIVEDQTEGVGGALGGTPVWEPLDQDYYGEIFVVSAGKKKKGFSSATMFTIKSHENTVQRGMKHFEWLHDRLTSKYSCICVPPLPDKSFNAAYEEKQDIKRALKLKQWLDRVIAHPVLGRDELSLKLFLTGDDQDKATWKDSKKRAEKDEFVGKNFFPLVMKDGIDCPADFDTQVERFRKFQGHMTKRLNKASETATQFSKRQANQIRKEYKAVQHAFQGIAEVFAEGGEADDVRQSTKIMQVSNTMESIGDMWRIQPGKDQMPWVDGLTEYQQMLSQYTEGLQSSKEANAKVVALEAKLKHAEEKQSGGNHGAMQEQVDDLTNEADAVTARANVIHMMTLSEIAHFHRQRRHDFSQYFKHYLQEQIDFHENIVAELKKAKSAFD